MLQASALIKRGFLHCRVISLGAEKLKLYCFGCQGLHSTPKNFTFFEKDPKSGYNRDKPKLSHREIIKKGFQQIKDEIKLWREEVVETFEGDLLLSYQPG